MISWMLSGLIKILLAPWSVSSAPSHCFKLMTVDFEPSTEIEKACIFLVCFHLVLMQSKPRRRSSILFVLPQKVQIGKSIVSLLQNAFLVCIVANAGKLALKGCDQQLVKACWNSSSGRQNSMNTQIPYLRRSSCLNCFTVLPNYHISITWKKGKI